jgi:hypothetical protein
LKKYVLYEKRAEKYAEFRELEEIVSSFGPGKDLEMLEAVQATFSRILRGDVPRLCINDALHEMDKAPDYVVPDSTNASFPLYCSARITLNIQLRTQSDLESPVSLQLASFAEHAVIGCLGPDPLEVELFHQSDPAPFDVADPAKVLTPCGVTVLEAGEQLPVRSGYDVIDLPQRKTSPAYLAMTLPVIRPYRVIYDRATLRPKCLSGVNEVDEQLIYVMRVAAALGDQSSVPLVQSTFEDHAAHHVRWEALQTLVSLAPDLAVECLKNALHDPHPELRHVATSTLPRLVAALAEAAA